MSNQHNNAPSDQFILSYELLKLMREIVEHHDDEFKQFLASILARQTESSQHEEPLSGEELQFAITDFLSLMEVLLIEIRNEEVTSSLLQRQLMPAVDHIDTANIDRETIANSIIDATAKFEKNPAKNPQELLFKELLRNWKPAKKAVPH